MDWNDVVRVSPDTLKEMVKVGQETFLVVVGVALHTFFWHYAMGIDLGIADPKDVDEVTPMRRKHYWTCYGLALFILFSVALRFLIGSRAHTSSTYSTDVSVWQFIRDVVFLMAFGLCLVRASLARRHHRLMFWLIVFSVLGITWSSMECQSPYGRLWLQTNLVQFLATVGAWFYLRNPPKSPPEIPYTHKLISVLSVLAAVYAYIFVWDMWKVSLIPPSTAMGGTPPAL